MASMIFLLFLVIILAFFHTLGEVLYKFSTTHFIKYVNPTQSEKKAKKFQFLILIGISIGISLIIKVFYGVLLGENPLSITAGLFLGCINIFSILFGRLFFKEKIENIQYFGLGLITIGIMLMV